MKQNIVLIPILLIFIVLFLLFNRITKIECYLEGSNCPDELLQDLKQLDGTSFFFANIEKKYSENQTIDSIYILESTKKKFLSTLVLNFKQEKIEYELIIDNTSYYLGNSGKIIPKKDQNIKTIIQWAMEEQILENSLVNPNVHTKALEIAHTIEQLKIEKATLYWNSNSEIILEIPDKPKFIFDSETIQTQIKKVDTIVHAKELEEIEAPILEIDMRFDLPVLRTAQ